MEPVQTICHDLLQGSDTRSDNRESHGERFDCDHGEAFIPLRWDDKNCGFCHMLRNPFAVKYSQSGYAPESRCSRPDVFAEGPVPNDPQW